MTKIQKSNCYGLFPIYLDADDPNGPSDEENDESKDEEEDQDEDDAVETEPDMDDPLRRPKIQEDRSQSENDFWRGL